MEEVRQLVQEEGREARNLVAFHVAVDSPSRVSRKPPRSTGPPRRPAPRPTPRLRSASAGRDKRSELRARYWALLFGDLQRAIGEIYSTVESHENLSECQEVILVLENYTRDFKALCEWFRLKWEYDNTPPPQRPQSLAWEVRKTDFVRPESRRAHSVKSSPSVSGKNSPSLSGHNTPSGKNSPNLTGKVSPGSGKVSPRVFSNSSTSPKANIEFFGSKLLSKVTSKVEQKMLKETPRLSDIKEKEIKVINNDNIKLKTNNINMTVTPADNKVKEEFSIVEIGKAKECPNILPKQVVIKPSKAKVLETRKLCNEDMSIQAKNTITQLERMENEFLIKHLAENTAKNDNILNADKELEALNIPTGIERERENTSRLVSVNHHYLENFDLISGICSDKTIDKESVSTISSVISDDNFADVSNESSFKSNGEICVLAENNENIDEGAVYIEANINNVEVKMTNLMNDVDTKSNPLQTSKSPDLTVSLCTDIHRENSQNMTLTKICDKEQEHKISEVNDNTEIKDSSSKEVDSKKSVSKVEIKVVKPAYSQAAAKPKQTTLSKPEVRTPTRSANMIRSKTVVDIHSNTALRAQRMSKRNQNSKCSYPFNLTTGRTSMFDRPSNKMTPKKLVNRLNLASVDVKLNLNKIDPSKRPLKLTNLKVNENVEKKRIINVAMENIKSCNTYSSSNTVFPETDISRIESSESLKTLVPEDNQDVANSIEVLNVNKSDNEGWLTVKSKKVSREFKKHFKSHWASRYHQPSATTSLPTLNLESPKLDSESFSTKLDRAKSEQPDNKSKVISPCKETQKIVNDKIESKIEPDTKPDPTTNNQKTQFKQQCNYEKKRNIKVENKVEKTGKVVTLAAKDNASQLRDQTIIRQKSDVTGLKTRSARSKALKKSEKAKGSEKDDELIKNRLHSSLESLSMGLARSQESTIDSFDFDKWKEEFKFTFKYLDDDDQIPNHNDLLKTADPSEMSEIAEMTSQIEENERKISLALDFQSEVDQKKLCEEEDLLNRQIMELQQVSDMDLDTETDETETDAEILGGHRSAAARELIENQLAVSLEDQYETALAGMSWAERVDTLVVIEALVARDPGRAQQLHAKLSQGIKRRGSLQDTLRRLQAKQARAERQRTEYQTLRARKIHQLLGRVEEVKIAKNQLIEEKRLRMERRLQKAAENRDQHLKDIVRKAHDEEEKLREIAFIKQLEAENRRHEFLDQCRAQNTRLRQMRRERLTKLEQKAAREAAVGARRQALEAARKLHVESLVERRRERDARVDQLKELKQKERDDAAREKAEGVKSRLSALAAAASQEADALRSRIRDKHHATQQRLETHLQAIRDRATAPRLPEKIKQCDPQTTSESPEQQSKEEKELEEAAKKLEQERKEKDKQRSIKKKARKVRQKLLSSEITYSGTTDIEPLALRSCEAVVINDFTFPDFPTSSKLYKLMHQLTNIVTPLMGPEPVQSQNGAVDHNDDKRVNGNEQPKSSKRSRKRGQEKGRLGQSESVCSSQSDMSKGSGGKGGGGDKRFSAVPDMPYLERQLNELHRVLERVDMEKVTFEKVHSLKIMGQLIEVIAEREDLTPLFTTKAVMTTVLTMSRLISGCCLSGTKFMSSNMCVHVAKLLSTQMEKDLHSDAKEMELARQLADCLSLGLDTVLCTTRLHQNETRRYDEKFLSILRGRAHTLISYICLSGCVTRAEKAGEARESIQALLTVCADLCQPSELDAGADRASAIQSLRCALGTGVCGSRDEFCMLFASGAGLHHCGAFIRAARTSHLLRALAELDHQIVQDAFREGGWPLEFRAAVARLLSQHAPSDKDAPRTVALRLSNIRLDQSLSETMVLDLIVLIGFVVVNNPQLQETICDGWSVIRTLCTLPANWLASKPHSHALLPTLVALSKWPSAAASIALEFNMAMLDEYMNSEDAQSVKLVQVIKQGMPKKEKGGSCGKK